MPIRESEFSPVVTVSLLLPDSRLIAALIQQVIKPPKTVAL